MTGNSELDALATRLRGAKHIAVLSGAGMSTESGIPDFRSANGLWARDMSLPEVVSIAYFRRNPVAFWQAFKDIFRIKLAGGYQPNAGHRFLAWLEQAGHRVSVLTQNIDGLHARAGSREVIELHGSLLSAHCLACGGSLGFEAIVEQDVPVCPDCAAVVKPDVVLYGEAVPAIEEAFGLALSADILLVLGSSLEVGPVNLIPLECARAGIPVAIINLSATGFDALFDIVIRDGIGSSCQRLQALLEDPASAC
ncbi:NAD-dependent protein deacylase [Paludibacterium yongneupense]|uniref:NAD-dependent protein deacylase n=1 Tax=Paludibacterium yongneupense TaxID=400061 RepID=UPI0003F5ACDE|nr:NAD-dependent protein deacylase [Paludibacterium yongneupense]